MKKYLFFTTALLVSTSFLANASFVSNPSATPPNSNHLKLADYINFSPADFESFQGKKMNIIDRISFKILKMKIRKELKKNPNMLVSEYYSKRMQKRVVDTD